MSTAFVVGIAGCTVLAVGRLQWNIHEREPTRAEAMRTQRLPWTLTTFQAMLWFVGLVIFTIAYGVLEPALIPKIIFVFGLAALVVVSIGYILIELTLRPVAADLITYGAWPSQAVRSAGEVGAGLDHRVGDSAGGDPAGGLFGVFRDETTKIELFVGVVVLAVVGLTTGPILTILGSMRSSGPHPHDAEGVQPGQQGKPRRRRGGVRRHRGRRPAGGVQRHGDGPARTRTDARICSVGTSATRWPRPPSPATRNRWRRTHRRLPCSSTSLGRRRWLPTAAPPEVVGLLNDFFAVIADDHRA